jgi:hypothetical protein
MIKRNKKPAYTAITVKKRVYGFKLIMCYGYPDKMGNLYVISMKKELKIGPLTPGGGAFLC